MHSLWQDARYGWRMMLRHPGFTLAAVVTLALGIGANSAVFSIVNVLSLKALSYHDPSNVVFLLGTDTETGETRFSIRLSDYLDIRRQAQSFEHVSAYTYLSANITGGDVPDRVQAYRVTDNTFELLRTPPAIGRTLASGDAQPGRERVAVISDGLWRRRFGGDASVVGRPITLNGVTYEIVGVMPPRFEFPVFNFKGDLWIPWTFDAAAAMTNRDASGGATVVARMRKDVDQTRAGAELRTIMQRISTDHPASNATLGARVVEMGRLDDEQAGPAMAIVVVTVAIVLLLACGNVANLLLARGISRGRELAVRAAVGASRWRIARQLLVESLMLAIAGGIFGIGLASLAVDAIRSVVPEMMLTTMPNIGELGIDPTTLMFTLALTVATSLVFGLVPAWRAARPQLQDGLKEGASGGGSRGTRRLRTTLVIGELALATMLLISAGLLTRSYAGLRSLSPGFSPDRLLTMTMTLPEGRYPTADHRRRFFEDVTERIAGLPGVRSAALVNVLPFSTYDRGTRFVIDGGPLSPPGKELSASLRVASPGYFATMEIPVIAGRTFEPADRDGTAPVALANRTFVQRYLAGGDAIGRRIRLGTSTSDPWLMIVGVVGDVHHRQLTQAPDPELYVPLAQAPRAMMMLAVRTEGKPEDLVSAVRGRVIDVDPSQPVFHIKSMSQLAGDAMLVQTTSAAMMTIFSAIALILALVGVYGVVSYGVSQQMPEFGLRLALGATPSGLIGLVLRRSAVMVATGVSLGSAAALAVSGALASILYGVKSMDPLTYSVAAIGLTLLGMCASIIPAWRATSAEPISALRGE